MSKPERISKIIARVMRKLRRELKPKRITRVAQVDPRDFRQTNE